MSIGQKTNALMEATTRHVGEIKNRKLVVGMTYVVGAYILCGLCVVLHPEALLGLSACLGGVGGGVFGIMWGIAKQATPGDPTRE